MASRRSERGREEVVIKLKTLCPMVPDNPDLLAQLEEDLTRMEYWDFRQVPWDLRDEAMVRELKEGAPNKCDHTIRRQPTKWTVELWREAYDFGKAGAGICTCVENFTNGKFSSKPDPKDGLKVEECIDPRAKRVLEY